MLEQLTSWSFNLIRHLGFDRFLMSRKTSRKSTPPPYLTDRHDQVLGVSSNMMILSIIIIIIVIIIIIIIIIIITGIFTINFYFPYNIKNVTR